MGCLHPEQSESEEISTTSRQLEHIEDKLEKVGWHEYDPWYYKDTILCTVGAFFLQYQNKFVQKLLCCRKCRNFEQIEKNCFRKEDLYRIHWCNGLRVYQILCSDVMDDVNHNTNRTGTAQRIPGCWLSLSKTMPDIRQNN